MPSSYIENVAPIMRVIENLRPANVLEIGVGYGKYGFLLRERVDDFRWHMQIVGIEVFKDYLDRSNADHLYDEIYFGDFLSNDEVLAEMLEHYGNFDLALMIDVLEHFTEKDGYRALDKALEHADKVLVSTPLGYPQGAVNGNEHETHRSEWPEEKLARYVVDRSLWAWPIGGGTKDSVMTVIGRA